MTNKMLEDLIKTLNKKVKRLTIIAIVLGVLFVAISVFVLTNYEIIYESYTEDTEYTVEQYSADGGNNTAIVDSNINKNNDLFVICGTIIMCAIVITGGLVIYGKTKNNS